MACEAKYHPHCRKSYTNDPSYWRSKDQMNRTEQKDLEQAHEKAFISVCEIVDQVIINGQSIMKLNDLRSVYIGPLENSNHPNPNFRSEKLKCKLQTYNHQLAFCKINEKGKFETDLVYNSLSDINVAIRLAYKLGTTDMVKEVALYLRKIIVNAFEHSDTLP